MSSHVSGQPNMADCHTCLHCTFVQLYTVHWDSATSATYIYIRLENWLALKTNNRLEIYIYQRVLVLTQNIWDRKDEAYCYS